MDDLADWFRVFCSDDGYIARSESQGALLQQRLYTPIQAMIALTFGDAGDSLAALRSGVLKLSKRRQLFNAERRKMKQIVIYRAECRAAFASAKGH